MTFGMLWFDDSQDPFSVKIGKAVRYYIRKYGRQPNLCLVHPSMYEEVSVKDVTIKPYRPVLPGHIWIGIEEEHELE